MEALTKLTDTMDEPARKRIKSKSNDQTNGKVTKTNVIPQSLIHVLYSESVAAKLWHVASRALGKVFIYIKRERLC
jgi:hypothetical protein